ncbi:hypothetical protein JW960_02910 [candidate division KSB1 bacterium]|nr:hypothetical protein [candidate division KSB1 bacterium]
MISNAIKFQKPDSAPIIKVIASEDTLPGGTSESFHCIQVRDNGIGFDEQYSDKIFIPFQRLHGQNEYKGSGIGLAICRQIAERHNGKIRVKSERETVQFFRSIYPVTR